MAVLRSDVIIPEVFTPYVIERVTTEDAFLQSGIVQPAAELNADEGGDTINVPFFAADLAGDFERLTDSTSLTPGGISADKQVGVVMHRGRAWESRDLAKLAAGSDPLGAIGQKVAAYVGHQRQKDLLACLDGVFGSLTANTNASAYFDLTIDSEAADVPTNLSPRTAAQARALLGDKGEKLNTMIVHSKVYYDLVERKAIDFVDAAQTGGVEVGGSIAGAYIQGMSRVPYYLDYRVIVSDDVQTAGSGATTEYAAYFCAPGSILSGTQMGLRTETDRDILAKSDALSIDAHYCYHPLGVAYSGAVNPSRTDLATAANWSLVYQLKNLGMVRATVTSSFD